MSENTKKGNLKAEIKSLLLVIFIALIIRTFAIELFFVPTSSMKATILENDYIFSTKYSYGFSRYTLPFSPDLFSGRIFSNIPERGDIVIMRPPHDMNTRYIKRLIGLPGDKVQIKDNVTYINDVAVTRVRIGIYADEKGQQYVRYKETFKDGLSFYSYKLKDISKEIRGDINNFGPYTVPANQFFFIGDNRDESGDSRYQLGFVPFENLIAKAQFILFSTEKLLWDNKLGFFEQILSFGPWLLSIRFNRLFTGMYDDN